VGVILDPDNNPNHDAELASASYAEDETPEAPETNVTIVDDDEGEHATILTRDDDSPESDLDLSTLTNSKLSRRQRLSNVSSAEPDP